VDTLDTVMGMVSVWEAVTDTAGWAVSECESKTCCRHSDERKADLGTSSQGRTSLGSRNRNVAGRCLVLIESTAATYRVS